MQFRGHKLNLRISGRVADWRNRLMRARYFRGHGVHSPFVYDLVRHVFMRAELLPGDRSLYEALLAVGIAERRAVQLQNLAIHCGYGSFGLNCAMGELCIVTHALALTEVAALVRDAAEAGRTVAVMTPYIDSEWRSLCRRLIAAHRSTTIDNRGYLLIFNNYLPKQHFRI
ncbi:MAG: hypothetical protein K1V70_04270 [Alistipes sp.]|jgi:hypothetical protein